MVKYVRCVRCGSTTSNFHKVCSACLIADRHAHYEKQDAEQDDPLRELPEDEYCVMCGREWGTDLRKDGKYYCSRCWMVWTS